MNRSAELTLHDIFGPSGILSGCLHGYEYREEQEEMAGAIGDALCDENHLIVEAGTGVGKSLAYLVPLCLRLQDEDTPRAIVSTYTKALQAQLYEKELPFLKRYLFPQLRFALSFGSENYVCLRRLTRTKQKGLFDVDEEGDMDLLLGWVRESSRGLRNEVAVSPSSWQKVKREPDTCGGKKCEYFGECFYQTAKALERKANIIITNHHLYFAHVASNYNVLPESPFVVFDEAHEIEGVASDYLGTEVSNFRLKYLLDAVISARGKGVLMTLPWIDQGQLQELSAAVDSVRRKGERFFQEISEKLGNRRSLRLREPDMSGEDLLESLGALTLDLEHLAQRSIDEDEEKEIAAIIGRCMSYREDLRNLTFQEQENSVYWISHDSRAIRFTATPLQVSDLLRLHVFDHLSSAICTSATLSVNGEFDFIRDVIGLPEADTVLLTSPFDFRKQAALYVPRAMPDPMSSEFPGAVAEHITEILSCTQGNTLVLFTSYALMDAVADSMESPVPILKQGDMDNFRLLEEFRTNQPSVLFGTYTFWQGIDLQGDILKCVVITKLPFAVPSEPVTEARLEHIRSQGRDPFHEFQVPGAVITFKQGFGRLIRSGADRGIVAVLDARIHTRSYGKTFIHSLPEMNIIYDLKKAAPYLKKD